MSVLTVSRRLVQGVGAVGIVVFSLIMVQKVLPYLSFEPGIHFLTTKSTAVNANTLFRVGFYVHIVSSLWLMVAGLTQFFPGLTRRNRGLHRTVGKVYVGTILLLAAPSGQVLALFANGGLAAKVGFTMQCILWWLATWQAYRLARQRRWQEHTEWMIRSYAITLAAMSLRLESYTMYYLFQTKPIETYLTVTWLSWTGNLLVAEVIIQAGAAKRLLRDFYAAPKPEPRAVAALV